MGDSRRKPKITVLGIGNTLMGDDGVGVAVVRDLSSGISHPNINVVIGETAGMGLVKHFRDSDIVIVVDSIATEAEPGTIFKFNPDEAGVLNLRSNNIHGMGVAYLVTNARLVGANPEVIIFGIQVGDVRPRDSNLTLPVATAARRVCQLVTEELQSLNV
ncbi:MAG: hydrogenase maturation protease [Candidatus Aquicultor sp.]